MARSKDPKQASIATKGTRKVKSINEISPKKKKAQAPKLSQATLSFAPLNPQASNTAKEKGKGKAKLASTQKRMRWNSQDHGQTSEQPATKKRKVLHPTGIPELPSEPIASTSRLPAFNQAGSSQTIPGIEDLSQLSYFDRIKPAQERHTKFMEDHLQIKALPTPKVSSPKRKRQKRPSVSLALLEARGEENRSIQEAREQKGARAEMMEQIVKENEEMEIEMVSQMLAPRLSQSRSESSLLSPRRKESQNSLKSQGDHVWLPPKNLSRSVSAPSYNSLTSLSTDSTLSQPAILSTRPTNLRLSQMSQTLTTQEELARHGQIVPTLAVQAPSSAVIPPLPTIHPEPSPSPESAEPSLTPELAEPTASTTATGSQKTQIIESFVDVSTYIYKPILFRSPDKSNLLSSPKKLPQSPIVAKKVSFAEPFYVPSSSPIPVELETFSPSPSISPIKPQSPKINRFKTTKKSERILLEETQFPLDCNDQEAEEELIEDSQFQYSLLPRYESPELNMGETQLSLVVGGQVMSYEACEKRKRKNASMSNFQNVYESAWSGQLPIERQMSMLQYFETNQSTSCRLEDKIGQVGHERETEEEKALTRLLQQAKNRTVTNDVACKEDECEGGDDDEEIISSQTQFVPYFASPSPEKKHVRV